jgi:hypothetical protein
MEQSLAITPLMMRRLGKRQVTQRRRKWKQKAPWRWCVALLS